MYRDKSVAVVVPCFNEETQVDSLVIKRMPTFIDAIIVVNDKSSDQTSEVVKATKEFSKGWVKLIEHEVNQGVGGAIATGYKWARDHDYDIAVVMAGDGQMDPKDLPAVLDPIVDDVADYTKGNRLVTGDAIHKIPKIRFFGNAALSLLTKLHQATGALQIVKQGIQR